MIYMIVKEWSTSIRLFNYKAVEGDLLIK